MLVGDPDQGLFAASTAFSRQRVQQVFLDAVTGAREKLDRKDAESLGRILYVVHLAVYGQVAPGPAPAICARISE